jgi:hypothetical protein
MWWRYSGGLAHEKFGSVARNKNAGVHGYPQAAELGPAEYVFQGQSSRTPRHQGGEFSRRSRRGDEQLRFVLGEDAACRSKFGDNDGRRTN